MLGEEPFGRYGTIKCCDALGFCVRIERLLKITLILSVAFSVYLIDRMAAWVGPFLLYVNPVRPGSVGRVYLTIILCGAVGAVA